VTSAIPRPSPCPPPVTMAVLPSNSMRPPFVCVTYNQDID
jgi:hypothetical protein